MNPYLKPFCHYREPDGSIMDMAKNDLSSIPNKKGAYIIVSRKNAFVYPKSTSPVIYIGTSSDLKRRMMQHMKAVLEIQSQPLKKRNELLWYSRYQYIVANGADVYWFTTRGLQKHKDLEKQLIYAFYDEYLAIPVGNNALSY